MITNTQLIKPLRPTGSSFMLIITQCDLCGHENLPIEVSEEAYVKWQMGAFVQDAFPTMSINEREKLISGLCDKCNKELEEAQEIAEAAAEKREYEEMIQAERDEERLRDWNE